jgi:hypothetical protein
MSEAKRRAARQSLETYAGTVWDIVREIGVHPAAELREVMKLLNDAIEPALEAGLCDDSWQCKAPPSEVEDVACDYDERGVCRRCFRSKP